MWGKRMAEAMGLLIGAFPVKGVGVLQQQVERPCIRLHSLLVLQDQVTKVKNRWIVSNLILYPLLIQTGVLLRLTDSSFIVSLFAFLKPVGIHWSSRVGILP